MVKIAVIGAGVNGLGTAVKIKESLTDSEVVLISNEFSPNTTGDGSGGLWCPYLCGNTPEEFLVRWGDETFKLYHKLWIEGGFDICLVPIYKFNKDSSDLHRPGWADVVYGYRLFTNDQLKYFSTLFNTEFKSGTTFSTFVVYPSSILKYLMKRFISANGKVLRAEITSLSDALLKEYDVIVNCTGLGARTLVPDMAVFPIRGQISKVKAPWINEVIIDEDHGHYIIPNPENCVMGGTHQEHNYSTLVNDVDTEAITKGCTNIMPGLKKAQLVKQWVGLRPGRHEIRLEAEERNGKLVIHNYGHGGSGLTLFWGCADDVVKALNEKLTSIKKSKL